MNRTMERLRNWGMGERVLKTTLAVMLAWVLGALVPGGTDHPYFAPLAALLSFQVTIADSITAAVQRIVGIVAGVTVALIVTHIVGENVWGVGLLVLLSLIVGANLRLSQQGVSQVATSALIVMFVGGSDSLTYAGVRIVEGIVGAVVGVSVNALLVPPTYLSPAREATRRLSAAIAQILESLADAVSNGLTYERGIACLEQARALNGPLATAQTALVRAETSLKYNVLQRAQQSQLIHYRRELTTLEHVAIQVRSIARALTDTVDPAYEERTDWNWTASAPIASAFGDLLVALASAVAHVVDNEENSQKASAALAAVVAARDHVNQMALAHKLNPEALKYLTAILTTAERMRVDLSATVAEPLRR